MYKKFQANGYSQEKIKKCTRPTQRNRHQQRKDSLFDWSSIFKVTSINDKFNGQFRKLIKKSNINFNIQVVTRPAPSLARQLNLGTDAFQSATNARAPSRIHWCVTPRTLYLTQPHALCAKTFTSAASRLLYTTELLKIFQPSRKTPIHVHATSCR